MLVNGLAGLGRVLCAPTRRATKTGITLVSLIRKCPSSPEVCRQGLSQALRLFTAQKIRGRAPETSPGEQGPPSSAASLRPSPATMTENGHNRTITIE